VPTPAGWGLAEAFILSQTVLPGLLYLGGTQPIRIPLRVGAFAVSLLALLYRPVHGTKPPPHPAQPWLLFCIAYLALMTFHPDTATRWCGLAQVMLYLAVAAPSFWAPRLVRDARRLDRLLFLLLLCNGVNAVVGVMQVYDPSSWLPAEFSTQALRTYDQPDAYEGPDGRLIVRPPGLSDLPGAVCGPAASAALLGLGFAVKERGICKRLIAFALAFAGMAAIYLTHVRSSLVVVGVSVLVYAVCLILQRRLRSALSLLIAAAGLVTMGLIFATMLGGEVIGERFGSLFTSGPATVYYRSGRGVQAEFALRLLAWRYPLGAGLGRWGMMRAYFGEDANPTPPTTSAIWAEIQLTAWVLDGGLVLLCAYSMALVLSLRGMVLSLRDEALRDSSAVVCAMGAGTAALIFSFIPFTAPVGIQFWFLSGALHGAASGHEGG
jgi:hypothetical protein